MRTPIHGSIPALVTPFNENGSLDLATLKALLDWHIAEGSDAVVVVGTTGESPTVNFDEHHTLIETAVTHVAGRIPVIAGTGANATTEAVALARFAEQIGADAHLSVVPYYNKPTQEGLFRHYASIAEAVALPMILYNVPGRTVADMNNDTVVRLAQIRHIVGIKDATGNLERGTDLLQRAPADFAIFSGDDASALSLMLAGGRGSISVTANVAPRLMREMCAAALAGHLAHAQEVNFKLLGLHRHLFAEANPIPVKWAVTQLGRCGGTLRLPMTPLSPDCHARVRAAMQHRRVCCKSPFNRSPARTGMTQFVPTRKLLAVTIAATLAAGCSIFPDSKKIDYKSAGKLPSLEVPPDLTQPSRDERYSVPDISPKGSATFSAYSSERGAQPAVAAGNREVLPDIGKMRIERAGTQRWLVVSRSADKVWPTLREFWQETGFTLVAENPETGVMETDWAENRAKLPQDFIRGSIGKVFDNLYSTSERDKFRTRIERGTQADTVEIYISHRGMYETYINEGKDQTRWQPRPADPDLEAEMLRRVMMRLGADESSANAKLASTAGSDRARMTRGTGGVDMLNIDESFDRAWRRVGLVLDRTGFTVEDRDRAQGVYFVRYLDPDAELKKKDGESSFLSKLMFWRDDDKKKLATPGDRFRILVKDAASATTVQVLTREGGADTSDTARKILGMLHEQLK